MCIRDRHLLAVFDAATPLTTAVTECRRHGVGSVTNGSFISIRERFQSKLELLERGGPEAEKLRHEYRSCQGFCDPSLAVWLPNPGCHHWHHTSVPCEEAYRFPFHHNASAFLDRMGGFVHIEGHDKPVSGDVPIDTFVARLQKRDAYKRPIFPDVLELDCDNGSENGRTYGGWSYLWSRVAQNACVQPQV